MQNSSPQNSSPQPYRPPVETKVMKDSQGGTRTRVRYEGQSRWYANRATAQWAHARKTDCWPSQPEPVQQPELHAVFATTHDHKTHRVSDPLVSFAAHAEWTRLDDLRRAGRLPQVKFFEVRSVTLGPDRPLVGPEVRSHDRYDRAPLTPGLCRPVVAGSRGHESREAAARKAWKLFAPTFRSWYDRSRGSDWTHKTGVQGSGGWYYYPNGQTVAQGLRSLGAVCQAKGLVVQGGDGRWYVVETEML